MTIPIKQAAALALASTIMGGSAASLLHAAPPAPLLLPLTQADTNAAEFAPPQPGSDGCTSGFSIGRKQFFDLTDRRLMLRTPAGRQVCTLTRAQADAMSNFKSSTACGGVRLSFHQIGPVKQGPPDSDSGSTPVIMTVSKGTSVNTLKGVWGTGC